MSSRAGLAGLRGRPAGRPDRTCVMSAFSCSSSELCCLGRKAPSSSELCAAGCPESGAGAVLKIGENSCGCSEKGIRLAQKM